jgi:hypothetical protein
MTRYLRCTLVAASVALACATAAFAQDKRPWVDPPGDSADETVTYPPAPPATNAAPSDPDELPPAEAPAQASAPASEVTGATAKPASSAAREQQRKPVAERKIRAPARVAARKSPVRAERPDRRREAAAPPSRARAAVRREIPAPPSDRRIRTVRDALDAGLTVTTVRTYRLPDGRRVEIVTERDPYSGFDMVVPPY